MKAISMLCVLLVAGSFSVMIQAETMQLEKFELQHTPAQDIIPLVKPFLVENASISAEDYTIILKTTPENMQQVKELIHDLDIPSKQLQISVSLDPQVILQTLVTNKTQQAPQADITTDENKSAANPSVNADKSLIYKTTGREVIPGIQIIKVLQNRWSMIRTGQTIPVMKRIRNPDGTVTESISHQQVNQGLRIKPQLSGQTVTLYVQPFYEAESQTGPGTKLYYKQEKVAHAMLGNWFGLETSSGVPIPINSNWIRQNQNAANPLPLIYLKVDIAMK